jgi:hypothetical protein
MIPFCCAGTAPTPARSLTHTRTHTQSRPTLLLNLSQNLSILEKEVFLQKKNQSLSKTEINKKGKTNAHPLQL